MGFNSGFKGLIVYALLQNAKLCCIPDLIRESTTLKRINSWRTGFM